MENLDVQQIGRYRLLDVIGRGGMGIVYRAIDTTIERKVAIKMLLGEGGQRDNDLLARFYREVRSTANLQHKNIVTVYALDDFDGLPYMVMEYLEGQSIAQLIAARQSLSIIEKIGLICQVCEGLQYAHERNVIHRDVKPANILVLKDGVAKIVDFGIARVGRSDNLTRTGQIVGSIYYMSPEQTTGVFDSRSDIYSTGVTLFEFLTGEVPFKGPDTQSTLLKILHDPVPPLRRYFSNYPKALETILNKAMAKEAAERYQTAEDFGYDLAQLQDTLKREMTDEFMAQAKTAMEDRSWDIARQKLQEILRLDRRNQPANELYKIVREQIQLQQRSQQIDQLKSQAEIALAGLQYEEALECIEQAKRLAPEDEELERISSSIREQMERARELSEALRRGQAALYAGDLSEAGHAVQRALELDSSNTEARTLDTLVRKEIEDRSRRAKLQGLLDDARREISARNFLSALKNLEKAQSIDPSDSNIRELVSWAASGHEQEKQRTELRRCTDEIGKMVAEDRYAEAAAACEGALQRFPDDIPLTKLYELAKRQRDALERRRVIDEIGLAARSLIEADRTDEAIRLLDSSLERFPADPNLEVLLEITRSHAEQARKEQEDRARQVSNLTADVISPIPEDGGHKIVTELLSSLENALSRRLSVPRMEPIALQLREAASGAPRDGSEFQRIQSALTEFAARAKSWQDTRTELDALSRSVKNAVSISQTDSALERAHVLVAEYSRDEVIREDFAKIRKLAEQFKARREAVRVQILDLLRSMQNSHSIAEIQRERKRIGEISADWTQDDLIRSLLDQVSACVDEVLQRRTTILKELYQLAESTSAARSIGQLRFFKEQAKMLVAEIDDTEVSSTAADVERTADARIHRIERSIARLTDLHTQASNAPTIATLKSCEHEALDLLKSDPEVEEAIDLSQRIQKLVEDRAREYKRIETSFEQLITKSKDAGKAELEAIVGRQRILLQKYPSETWFQDPQHRLEQAIAERYEYLKSATTDLQIEPDMEETKVVELGSVRQDSISNISAAKPHRNLKIAALAGVLVVTLTTAALWFSLRHAAPALARLTIHSAPSGAWVKINRTPSGLTDASGNFNVQIKPGTYLLEVGRDGFEPFSQNLSLNVGEQDRLEIPLKPLSQIASGTLLVTGNVVGAEVVVDGFAKGFTEKDGTLKLTLEPKSHSIHLTKPGYAPSDLATVTIGANVETRFPYSLKQTAAALQPPTVGNLAIHSTPSLASVKIDDNQAGNTDVHGDFIVQVKPGRHTVEVSLPGYQPYRNTLPIKAGDNTNLPVLLSEIPHPAAQPVQIVSFSPAVSRIEQGQHTTLTWKTANATQVSLDDGSTQTVAQTTGNIDVSPSSDTTYILTATGGDGRTQQRVARIAVAPKPLPPAPTGGSHEADQGAKTSADLDAKAISGLLEAYQGAFESKDLIRLRHIWPTLTDKQFKEMGVKDAQRIRLTLQQSGPAQISGDHAVVSCSQTAQITSDGTVQSVANSATFSMKRLGNDWIIEKIVYGKSR